jgi:hypothetical protein
MRKISELGTLISKDGMMTNTQLGDVDAISRIALRQLGIDNIVKLEEEGTKGIHRTNVQRRAIKWYLIEMFGIKDEINGKND